MSKPNTAAAAPDTTALATTNENESKALALLGGEFEADAGSGFEDAGSSSYAIPFLKLLAAMSKQCKRGTPEYIQGAQEGDFFNTVTQETFDGEVGLTVIPVHHIPKFIEYEGTVDEGGGFVKSMSSAEGMRLMQTTTRDADGNERLPRGADGKEHILVDVREHYLIVMRPGTQETFPCLLSLSSSGIPVSRNWMSQMGQFKRNPLQANPDPMFSHVFQLTSYMKPSKKVDSTYATYKFTHLYAIEKAPWAPEIIQAVYAQAKAFKEQLQLGQVKTPDYAEAAGHEEFNGQF